MRRRCSAGSSDASSAHRAAAAAWLPSSMAWARLTLVVDREQVDAPDLLQVHAHRVGGAAGVDPLVADAWCARRRRRASSPSVSSGGSSIAARPSAAHDAAAGARDVAQFVDADRRCVMPLPAEHRPALPASTSPVSSTLRSTWAISSACSTPRPSRARPSTSIPPTSTPTYGVGFGSCVSRPVAHPRSSLTPLEPP